MTEQIHGGMPQDSPVFLDFSVNTNPLGMPQCVKAALRAVMEGNEQLWESYPDPLCGELRKELADCHHTSAKRIVCGNGASELIVAAVRAFQRRKGAASLACVLPVPSFLEYERALRAVGAGISYYFMKEEENFAVTESFLEKLTPDMDLLFLCSPNNPTGSLLPEALLKRILDRCRENGIGVVLDTCFWELAQSPGTEEESVWNCGACPDLVVLKAFTKLYAVPGLRLGYGICSDSGLAGEIMGQLPCWNVSGAAQLAGLTVMKNKNRIDYISQTRELIGRERSYLEAELQGLGMQVLPGQANFLCFYSEEPLYEKLLQRGILIRDCGNFRGLGAGWYRVAVKKHTENMLLTEQIRQVVEKPEREGENKIWGAI